MPDVPDQSAGSAGIDLREAISGLRGSLDIVVTRVGSLDDLKKSLDEVATQLSDVRTLAARAATTAREGGRLDEAVIELATVVRSITVGFDALREVVERKEDDAAKLLGGVVDALHDTAGRIGGLDRAVRALPEFTSPGAHGGGAAAIPEAVIEGLSHLGAIAPLQDEMARVGRAVDALAPQIAEIAGVQRALGELGSGLGRLEETAIALAEAQVGLATGRSQGGTDTVDLEPVAQRLEASIERSAGSLARGVEWLHGELTQAMDAAIGSRTAPLQRAVDLLRDELVIRLESGGERPSGEAAAETATRLLASLRSDAEQVTTALGALRDEQNQLTGGVRAIGLAQQDATRELASLGADLREALTVSEAGLAGLAQEMTVLREASTRPAVPPEVRDGLSRIDASLSDARAQLSSLAERPTGDPKAMADLLAGLTFVATKLDSLARPAAAEPGAELTAIDATLTEMRARLAELRERLPDPASLTSALEPLSELRGGLTDVRARIEGAREAAEVLAETTTATITQVVTQRLDALGTVVSAAAERRPEMPDIAPLITLAEEIRHGVQAIASATADGSTQAAQGMEELRDRLSETTGHLVAAREAAEGLAEATTATITQVVTQRLDVLGTVVSAAAERRPEMPDIAPLVTLAEEIRHGVQAIASATADGSTQAALRMEELRDRVSETTGHLVAALETLSGLVLTSRDDTASALEEATARASERVAGELATLQGTFIDVSTRLDEFLTRGAELAEDHAAVGASLRSTTEALGLLAGRSDQVSAAVDAGFEGTRTQVGAFQSEVREAFTTVREDVTLAVERARTDAGEGLEGLRSQLIASTETLTGIRARIDSLDSLTSALDTIDARLVSLPDTLDRAVAEVAASATGSSERSSAAIVTELSAAFDGLRGDVHGGFEETRAETRIAVGAAGEAAEAARAQIDLALERSREELAAALEQNARVLQEMSLSLEGSVQRSSTAIVTELGAALDATAADVVSHLAAAREDIRASAVRAASATDEIPILLAPATEEIARIGGELERAIDASTAMLRVAAEAGTAQVGRMVEDTSARAGEQLHLLGEAVQMLADRVEAHGASVTDEVSAMGQQIPQLAEVLSTAVEGVAQAGGELDRRAGEFVTLATDALGQFAEEVTDALVASRADLDMRIAGGIEGVASMIDERAQAGAQTQAVMQERVSSAVDAVVEVGGELDRRAGELVTLASDALGQFAQEVTVTLGAGRSDLDARITAGIEDLASMIDERAEHGAVAQAAGQQSLETRLEHLSSSLEGRLQAMEDRLSSALDGLAEQTGARLDEIATAASTRIDDALIAMPTTDEVTQILHERAAGALRSVRRRLVRMDDVIASLGSAESAMYAISDRIMSLEAQVNALPTAAEVVEVALSGRRGLGRKRQPAPTTVRPPLGRPVPVPPARDPNPPRDHLKEEAPYEVDDYDDEIISIDLEGPATDHAEPELADDLSAEDELFLIDAVEEVQPAKTRRASSTRTSRRAPAKGSGKAKGKAKATVRKPPKAKVAAPRSRPTPAGSTKARRKR